MSDCSPTGDHTTLYRFFDADDRLLYVGIAGNPGRRFGQHSKAKLWWADVARSTMEHHPTRDAAAAAEVAAIVTEAPRYNVLHNRNLTTPPPRHFCRWACFECGHDIANGEGYIQCMPRGRQAAGLTEWESLHRQCDQDVHGSHYWIDVSRVRTEGDLIQWDDHLSHKRWSSNWRCLVAAQHCGDRAFGDTNPGGGLCPFCGFGCTARTAYSMHARPYEEVGNLRARFGHSESSRRP